MHRVSLDEAVRSIQIQDVTPTTNSAKLLFPSRLAHSRRYLGRKAWICRDLTFLSHSFVVFELSATYIFPQQ